MRVVLGLGVCGVLACPQAPEPTRVPISPAPPPEPAPSASAAPASVSSSAPGAPCDASRAPHALRELPCTIEDPDGARGDGFSRDKRWFGRCFSACEVCGADCAFVDVVTQKRLKFRLSDELRGGTDAERDAAARRDKPHLDFLDREYGEWQLPPPPAPRTLSGPFPYDDIVFSAKSTYDEATGKAHIALGARVAEEPAVYPYSMSFGPHEGWKYAPRVDPSLRGAQREAALAEAKADLRASFVLEPPTLRVVDVSPDGKHTGFVVHVRGSRFVDLGEMLWLETPAMVGRLYNEAGFAAHEAGRYDVSSALFGKASRAAPKESLYAYNEACALARRGDAGVEAALRRAIELGGRAVAVRAQGDADLASVRSVPWFVTLIR